MVRTAKDPEDRFWEKVQAEPNTGCWLWDGTITTEGYGELYVPVGSRFAHRFSYELLVGPIPEGLQIDHLCRIRNCVNPEHLEPVTHKENVRRGESGLNTGRLKAAKTHCPHGHPYSGSNLFMSKRGYRLCRICKATISMRYRQKKQRERHGLCGGIEDRTRMTEEITWGIPAPTFRRAAHAFKNNRSLCGLFENVLPRHVDRRSNIVCTTCRKSVAALKRDHDNGN